jgi:hypothetical protein
MTSLHHEMLEILAKRAELVLEQGTKEVLVYKSTGSPTIDSYLLDIVNQVSITIIQAKIESDFKSDKYTEALVYAFQKLNDKQTFNADEVFHMFN